MDFNFYFISRFLFLSFRNVIRFCFAIFLHLIRPTPRLLLLLLPQPLLLARRSGDYNSFCLFSVHLPSLAALASAAVRSKDVRGRAEAREHLCVARLRGRAHSHTRLPSRSSGRERFLRANGLIKIELENFLCRFIFITHLHGRSRRPQPPQLFLYYFTASFPLRSTLW